MVSADICLAVLRKGDGATDWHSDLGLAPFDTNRTSDADTCAFFSQHTRIQVTL